MLTIVEGVYRNGQVELLETPQGFSEERVFVTFVDPQNNGMSDGNRAKGMLQYGKYPGDVSTLEDFKPAEIKESQERT